MSHRTYIPKWQPYRGQKRSRRGFGRFDGGDMGVRNIRTIGQVGQAAIFDPPARSRPLKAGKNGAVKVGMFMNAKRSEVVYNEMPSNVRRAVAETVKNIVAPVEENNIYGVPLKHKERQRTAGFEYPETYEQPEPSIYREDDEPVAPRRRRSNETVPKVNSKMRNNEAGPSSPIAQISRNTRPHDQNGNAYLRGFLPVLARRRKSLETTRKDSFFNPTQALENTAADRADADLNVTTVDELARRVAEQKRILRTPGRNSTAASNLDAEACQGTSSTKVPSKQLSARILSSLPSIYLTDNDTNTYICEAHRLIQENMYNSDDERRVGERTTLNLRSLLDQTSRIRTDDYDETQADDGENEFVFANNSRAFEEQSSGRSHHSGFVNLNETFTIQRHRDSTPEMERAFNETCLLSKDTQYPEEFGSPDNEVRPDVGPFPIFSEDEQESPDNDDEFKTPRQDSADDNSGAQNPFESSSPTPKRRRDEDVQNNPNDTFRLDPAGSPKFEDLFPRDFFDFLQNGTNAQNSNFDLF